MLTIRERLEKLSKTYEPFYPTLNDCKLWYRVLNKEIFENVLPKRAFFDIRKRRGAWAYFDMDNEQYLMNVRYRTKKQFVEILAHEMIHHIQMIEGDSVNHGPSFYTWSEVFADYGLNLKR